MLTLPGEPTVSEQRYKRLEELRAEAAVELSKPVDSDDVTTLAALRLSRENLLARLTSGTGDPERISERLLTVGAAIKELSLSSPPTVDLVITRGVLCPQCRTMRPMTAEELAQPAPQQSSRRSSPASPPASTLPLENATEAKNNNHAPAASPSPPNGKSKPKVERPFHEVYAKDSRPDAASRAVQNGGGGSLVWWSSKDHRGPI
jgi:hypothetical protein